MKKRLSMFMILTLVILMFSVAVYANNYDSNDAGVCGRLYGLLIPDNVYHGGVYAKTWVDRIYQGFYLRMTLQVLGDAGTWGLPYTYTNSYGENYLNRMFNEFNDPLGSTLFGAHELIGQNESYVAYTQTWYNYMH